MRVRSQRTHLMGASNRQKESNAATVKDVIESSFLKTQNVYYQSGSSIGFAQQAGRSTGALTGVHTQFPTARITGGNQQPKTVDRTASYRAMSLEYAKHLNDGVRRIQQQFAGKDINMDKLSKIKNTLLINNQKRRNLKREFERFSDNHGRINQEQFRRLVKEYGYDINQEEIDIVFQLTKKTGKDTGLPIQANQLALQDNQISKQDNGLAINEFLDLMTKDNVYFRTLKLPNSHAKLAQRVTFPAKVQLILRNKFNKLKQAFSIYQSRGEPITEDKFHYVMKKLDINDLTMTPEERMHVYSSFVGDDKHFSVEGLLETIAAHEKVKEANESIATAARDFRQNVSYNEQRQAEKQRRSNEFLFKRMSNPDYEKHFSKAQQVLQELRKLHSSENVLDKLCRGSTTKVELRGNIELLLQQQGINFDKQTYDCLSSYLDYNCRGEICQTQLRKFLVEETDKEAMERFERRVRAEPGEHKPTTNRVDEKQALQSLQKLKISRLNPTTNGLFREFKKDSDGYVSRNQLKHKIEAMCVLQPQEVENLANYFDSEGKGQVGYLEFTDKFAGVDRAQKNWLQASEKRIKSRSDWLATKQSYIKADNEPAQEVSTKYSAWPKCLLRSDLSLLEPHRQSGQYQSEASRFHNSEKHTLGQDHKQIRYKIYENKLRRMAGWNEAILQQIQAKSQQEQQQNQAQAYSKRLAQEIYQLRCHQG